MRSVGKSYEVEVRQFAGDLSLLAVLGVGSIALTTSLAYALLGSHDLSTSTADSIGSASAMVIGILAATIALLAVVLVKPRPFDAVATVDGDHLLLARSGGNSRRRLSLRSLRHVYPVLDGEQYAVEFERWGGSVRLLASDRVGAEELAAAILGIERAPAAMARVRSRADYYHFVTTIMIWLLVYTSLCALPPAPLLGGLLLAVSLPLAVWVTLRAVPKQVLISAAGISIVHPLATRRILLAEIAAATVVDDDCIEIEGIGGGSLRIPELVDHPHDRSVSPSNPPAERLAAAITQLLEPAPARAA